MVRKERRKHKRASLEIPLDMKHPGSDDKTVKARTVNLSAGGFYCKLPFHIPVLTKLKVSMSVPILDADGRQEDHAISCEGMVVRVVPEKPDSDVKSYEIGCFFTDMDSYDRLIIEQYLAEKAE
jgi:c-di-GMP-binding flagellar brake protein YcgR